MKIYLAEVHVNEYKNGKSESLNYNLYASANKYRLIERCREYLKISRYEIIDERDDEYTHVIHSKNKDLKFIHIWIEEIETLE